jgi:multidrug resistance efflux pump
MQNKIGAKIFTVIGITIFISVAVLLSLYPVLASKIASLVVPSKYGKVSDYKMMRPNIKEVDLYLASRNARLVSLDNVTLAFQLPGRVKELSVSRGDVVQKDAILASLDKSDLSIQENQAMESLNQAISTLQKTKKGARAEDIAVSTSKQQLTETAIDTQKKTLQKTIEDLVTIADDTFYNKLSGVFTVSKQGKATLRMSLYDMNLEGLIQSESEKFNAQFISVKKTIASPSADIEKKVQDVITLTDSLASLYDKIAQGVNGARSDDQSIVNARAQVAEARSSLSSAKLAFSNAYASYKTAKESLSVSQSETKLVQAGSSKEDIDIAEAVVKERATQVQGIRNQLNFARLISPSSNLIVKDIFVKRNETVSAGQPIILLAYMGIKVQVDIQEEDIASLATGDEGIIFLRSFKDTPIKVKVDSVEPHEIIKNESTYFRVNLELKDVPPELSLRTGMTGDVSILTKKKRQAVLVPKNSLYVDGSIKYLLVDEDGQVTKKVISVKNDNFNDDEVEIEGDVDSGTKILYK